VAGAALRILDDYGLPDLTMRRLAAALNVQPSALYWHFPNKQTLLADLADRIVAPAAAPRSADWAADLRAEAAALRDALLAYRDGAEVVASTLAIGMGPTIAHERLATAISAGGFDDATARNAATALQHFILGHASHEQQRMQYDSIGVLAPRPGESASEHDDPTAEFTFGVDLIVAGLQFSRTRA